MANTSKNTLETGTVLGDKWVILELLGRGGMGEVYRVHQLNLKRDIAVKIISPKLLAEVEDNDYETESCLERFHREVQVMAQVRHPNVLQIFDCGSISVKRGDEETPIEYIAMEYVSGGSLRSTMSAEGFHPGEDRMKEWLCKYFLPLLDGVEALHELGIVHRDLKPENVLVDADIPRIADFGLARSCRLRPVTQSMDMRGTPPYMSPEHFLDLKRTDQRTDVYALGKILYEAASGKVSSDEIPFKQACLKGPETPFYQKLDRVIQAATVEDRNQRLESVESLRQAILEVIADEGQPVLSASSARTETIRPWKGRLGALVLVVAISIATGLGVMFFHKRGYVSPESSLQTELSVPAHSVAPGTQGGVSSSLSEPSSPPAMLQGKDEDPMHLIAGGTIVLREDLGPDAGKTVKVDSFYLDETLVTNQQYVQFLNGVLQRVKVENGVVRGDGGKSWLFLGEVKKGYEPIIFSDGKFRVKYAAHGACPVLRVTAHGAGAYARFYGQRLMTDVEWLYALKAGGKTAAKVPEGSSSLGRPEVDNQPHVHNPDQGPAPAPSGTPELSIPTPVIMSKPNAFGIRNLNESVGEWGLRRAGVSPSDKENQVEYVVLGGLFSKLEIGDAVPSAIRRNPWEAFTEVGFRCASSISGESGQAYSPSR